MAEQVTEKVTKKKVLVDSHVRITPDDRYWFDVNTPEKYALALEQWAKEVREFVRDHRSQDINGVDVVREYQEQCTGCHREWEEFVDEETGKTCCANCGEEIEVVQ